MVLAWTGTPRRPGLDEDSCLAVVIVRRKSARICFALGPTTVGSPLAQALINPVSEWHLSIILGSLRRLCSLLSVLLPADGRLAGAPR